MAISTETSARIHNTPAGASCAIVSPAPPQTPLHCFEALYVASSAASFACTAAQNRTAANGTFLWLLALQSIKSDCPGSSRVRILTMLCRNLQGFVSPPVRLDLIDLALDRTATAPLEPAGPAPPAGQQHSATGTSSWLKPQASISAGKQPADLTGTANVPPEKTLKISGGAQDRTGCHPTSEQSHAVVNGMQVPLGSGISRKGKGKPPKAPHSRALLNGHASQAVNGRLSLEQSGPLSDHPSSSNSESAQPAASADVTMVAGPALSRLEKQPGAAQLPPTGIRGKKPAKGKQKLDSSSQPAPARKKLKVDAPLALAGNGPSAADAADETPGPGLAQKAGKAGKARKIMSLSAASMDTSLDKSPLQPPPPGHDHDSQDAADRPSGPSQAPGAFNNLLGSDDPASEVSQPRAAAVEPAQAQAGLSAPDVPAAAKRETKAGSKSKPGRDGGGPANASSKSSVLSKRYGSTFIWGQLSGWFKQTVYDPTASLSAERRGTISLPDIESCYGGSKQRYNAKVGSSLRASLLCPMHHLPMYRSTGHHRRP